MISARNGRLKVFINLPKFYYVLIRKNYKFKR